MSKLKIKKLGIDEATLIATDYILCLKVYKMIKGYCWESYQKKLIALNIETIYRNNTVLILKWPKSTRNLVNGGQLKTIMKHQVQSSRSNPYMCVYYNSKGKSNRRSEVCNDFTLTKCIRK